MRSPSPVSGVSPVAAATHGGATYFLSPGQGISNLSHAFGSASGRNESRTGRGQGSAGTVPFGSRFIPDQLREELRRRHALIHAQVLLNMGFNMLNLSEGNGSRLLDKLAQYCRCVLT